jgi:ribosomal protein L34E
MDEIATLYQSGLSIREVSRRTGVSFGAVRHHLTQSGLHQIKHKRIRNGMATCNRCGDRQTVDKFPQRSYGTYRCSKCLRAVADEHQLARQGSSTEEYRTLFAAQDGKCAICGALHGHRSQYDRVCRFAVDHDHRTDKVRGLLCNNCNRGLGHFKDSIENLESALRYLKREQ